MVVPDAPTQAETTATDEEGGSATGDLDLGAKASIGALGLATRKVTAS